MARFYGSVSGKAQSDATREGTEASGINGHIRGWNSGIRVVGHIAPNGDDAFDVYLTAGSHGGSRDIHVGTYDGLNFTMPKEMENRVRFSD
jgi:hypothetical protein